MNIEVIELNGISIYDAGAASITTSEPQCSYEERTVLDSSTTDPYR